MKEWSLRTIIRRGEPLFLLLLLNNFKILIFAVSNTNSVTLVYPFDQNLCPSILLTTLLLLKIWIMNAYRHRTKSLNLETLKFKFYNFSALKHDYRGKEKQQTFRNITLNEAKLFSVLGYLCWIVFTYPHGHLQLQNFLPEIFFSLIHQKIAMNFSRNILQS